MTQFEFGQKVNSQTDYLTFDGGIPYRRVLSWHHGVHVLWLQHSMLCLIDSLGFYQCYSASCAFLQHIIGGRHSVKGNSHAHTHRSFRKKRPAIMHVSRTAKGSQSTRRQPTHAWGEHPNRGPSCRATVLTYKYRINLNVVTEARMLSSPLENVPNDSQWDQQQALPSFSRS